MDIFTPQNGKKSRFLKQEILQIRQKQNIKLKYNKIDRTKKIEYKKH